MPTSIARKLKIKPGATLLTINAPDDFEQTLDPLPEDVRILKKGKSADQLHWFVRNRLEMESGLAAVLERVQGDTVCWIYYPKGSSKLQTDLTRDKGWEALLAQPGLQWISLISFDPTWSVFGFRRQNEADKKRAAAPKERPIFDYIDPVKKEVRLPDDLAAALHPDKAATAFFNSLSFSNRKEYVEWIVTAKREETRRQRVEGTLERLAKGWKNPRNM
ncbi:YdeI/OmpD-associated family protein [Flaviaesturariibacter flavus]|nr:YdeI/OmpD-associated family protein [Flaviaesturariibacter flavus]